mmetsp:Transcript_91241/g.144131  ORF Transcript_91241/g.144131 Transcript_91241/m.144131 type:complete len:538 (-) Transcript_91241:130-1743(-)
MSDTADEGGTRSGSKYELMLNEEWNELAEDDPTSLDDPDLLAEAEHIEESRAAKQKSFRQWIFDSQSNEFHIAVGCVIAVNSIVIGLETDFGAEHFLVSEYVFCIVYICEMTMRLVQETPCGYFSSLSSWFDCSLVVTGSLDLFVLSHLGDKGRSLKFLKTGRLLRALRVVRLARLFKLFHGLEMILKAYANAFQSVIWVGTVIIIFDYILAVFCTQLIGHKADQWPEESQPKIELWFGTIGRSMRTLFIVMTLASWDVICYTLMERIPGYVIFPLACSYIMLASYTMVSLITGVISESLITAQNKDEQNRVQELEKSRKQLGAELFALLESMDPDRRHPGKLSRQDVEKALRDHKDIIPRLHAHEIKISKDELLSLIGRLPHTDHAHPDLVEISLVRDAIMTMEGVAKASAVQDLKHKITALGREVKDVHEILRGAQNRRGRDSPMKAPSTEATAMDSVTVGPDTDRSLLRTVSEASMKSIASKSTVGASPEAMIHKRVVALGSQMQRLEASMGENQHKVEEKLDRLVALLQSKKE